MTVNPGWGGQPFIEHSLRQDPARCGRSSARTSAIEVDGGIDAGDRAALPAAGANVFVAGSAIFAADDPGEAYLRDRARGRRD